jgi:2-methylisocitrate lyase-like PEP mutase family enzyme
MSEAHSAQLTAIHTFRELHRSGCFVLPNPWDIGTTLYLQQLGFKALATTSAGFAFSRGRADGAVPRDEMLAHIREVCAVATVPVNADFLAGFADEPEALSANVGLCIETGIAGLSIEDSTGHSERPLFPRELALERLRAARESVDQSGKQVVLTARSEAFLVRQAKPLETVLDRLPLYAEAGADCLYAPGVTDPNDIRTIVQAVAPKPVNVLVSGFNSHLSLEELARLGVRRISVGSGLALAAWGRFTQAARSIAETGQFNSLAGGATSAELNQLFASRQPYVR